MGMRGDHRLVIRESEERPLTFEREHPVDRWNWIMLRQLKNFGWFSLASRFLMGEAR